MAADNAGTEKVKIIRRQILYQFSPYYPTCSIKFYFFSLYCQMYAQEYQVKNLQANLNNNGTALGKHINLTIHT